jgi:predicted secreted Zn-dependent protease
VIPQRTWRKSSHSDDGNCVEVAYTHELAVVRDSKNGTGPVLRFESVQWQAFMNGVRLGEFESSASVG